MILKQSIRSERFEENFFNILPFIFPVLAIYIVWSGKWSGIGKYTITIAEWLIILVVVYSIYNILLQKRQ